MLEALKKEVLEQNLELVKTGLVLNTWGNVSAIDNKSKLIVIKPSGVPYSDMKAEDMVVVDLEGNVIEGKYKPSSDTPTHIEIYKNFKTGGVVHTHSKWATIWAQAGASIPYLGTTHADYFYGDIPITRVLTYDEIQKKYEKNTGVVIKEAFVNIDHKKIQAVLVNNHGPFTWGEDAKKAVDNAVVLEYIAEMAYYTKKINPEKTMEKSILDKHYLRKHGKTAYYGQKINE